MRLHSGLLQRARGHFSNRNNDNGFLESLSELCGINQRIRSSKQKGNLRRAGKGDGVNVSAQNFFTRSSIACVSLACV
jgi:hypothetical protein